MERIFLKRDRWGNGISLWILGAVLFTLPVMGIGLRDLDLENDVTSWLPSEDPDARILDWFHHEFEHDSSLLFSWDSSQLNDPRVIAFAEALRSRDDEGPRIRGLKEITTPLDVIELMRTNNVDDETAIDRLEGVLVGTGFLKVRLTASGERQRQWVEQASRQIVRDVTGRTAQVLPPVPKLATNPTSQSGPPADTESEVEEIVPDNDGIPSEEPDVDRAPGTTNSLAIDHPIPPHDFQLRWPALAENDPQVVEIVSRIEALQLGEDRAVESAFFASGAPIAISIALNEHGEEYLTETIAAIRTAALESGIPAEEIRMGGTPVGREQLSREAKRAVWNNDGPAWNLYQRTPVLLSGLVGVITSFLLLRSARLAILVVAAAVYTCLLVLALVPLSGKTLNIVLVVLPDLLLVLTISGAIHVANYWKHAVTNGDPHPIATAVRMAWRPCMLASTTTAIGMASLMTAVLNPVVEFGIYSSIGCLISLLVILLVFPSLLSIWPQRPDRTFEAAERDEVVWGKLGKWIFASRYPVIVGCLVVFVVSVWGLQWFRTETKVIRYFTPESRVVEDYDFLEEGLAGIVSIEAVVQFDDAAQQETTIVERMESVRNVEARMAEHPWISGTISLADFRPHIEPPGPDASTRNKILYRRRAQRMEEAIFESQSASAEQFVKKVSQPLTVQRGGEAVTAAPGNEIWRVRAQASVMGDVDYGVLTQELRSLVNEAVNGLPGTTSIITGMVPLFLRTQNAVLESLIESFALAFCIIAVVMIILLRSPLAGILAMLPNLFPVGVVFGLVSWAGVPVDIGTMITASVALGIAIDGTLHLLTWFQEGIREGLSRENAVVKSLAHCGPAMWQTSLAISAGMFMLSGADLLLISRFGWLISALILVALVADVILLPALLSGWLGALIEASVKKRMAAEQPSQTPMIAEPMQAAGKS